MSEAMSETNLFIAEKDLVGCSAYDGSTISVPKGTVLMQTYFDEYSIEYMMVSELKEISFPRSVKPEEYADPENYDKYFAGVDGIVAMSLEERAVYVRDHLEELLRVAKYYQAQIAEIGKGYREHLEEIKRTEES